MKVSSKGLELIKEFEGFSSVAYLCSAKKATIGYGNTFWEDGTPVKIGDQISKERAETLLKHVVDNFSVAVEVDIKIEVTQNQFDALVSLCYNIGSGAFSKSTLVKKLNAKDYAGAADQFLVWNKGGGKVMQGLVKRRARERELFLKGN